MIVPNAPIPQTAASPAGLSRILGGTARQQRHFRHLMGQQFWLFGYDIRRPEGNVLVDLGFVRCPPPPGSRVTSSRYMLEDAPGLVIGLWGFGMYFGDGQASGLFVDRNGITLRLHTAGRLLDACWDPTESPSLQPVPAIRPAIVEAKAWLGVACGWMARYEAEIAARRGEAYRRTALAAWKRPCCPASRLGEEWLAFADMLEHADLAG